MREEGCGKGTEEDGWGYGEGVEMDDDMVLVLMGGDDQSLG